MRMWNVNPKMMCRKHLLGEHLETHMFVGSINKGISMQGYVDNGLVETHNLKSRHDALAEEMKSRGYNHESELVYDDRLKVGVVDTKANIQNLHDRCPMCRERILKHLVIEVGTN